MKINYYVFLTQPAIDLFKSNPALQNFLSEQTDKTVIKCSSFKEVSPYFADLKALWKDEHYIQLQVPYAGILAVVCKGEENKIPGFPIGNQEEN